MRPQDDISVSKEEDELQKLMKNQKKIFASLKKRSPDIAALFAAMYRDSNAIELSYREDFIDKFKEMFKDIELEEEAPHIEEDDGIILTRATFDKYQAELKEIVDTGLNEATKAIVTAREFGDISENAELDIAQEYQRKVIARKAELEKIISTCKVIGED